MISNRNMNRVSLICHATVCHMFARLCNPKCRGPKFEWSHFPEMMKPQCREQVYLARIRGRDQQAIFEHAEKTGYQIAKMMVEAAGFS